MKFEIAIPSKYVRKLEDVEKVELTIRDQIEVEVLPQILRLINDAHRQLQQQHRTAPESGDRLRVEVLNVGLTSKCPVVATQALGTQSQTPDK